MQGEHGAERTVSLRHWRRAQGGNTCQQLLPSLADACVDGSPALSGALLVNTLQLAVRQTGTQRRPVVLADLQVPPPFLSPQEPLSPLS